MWDDVGGVGVTTGRCSRRSRGGIRPDVRGGMCPQTSAPGRRYGNGIVAGQPREPSSGCSMKRCGVTTRGAAWHGCCRSIPPSCELISTPPVLRVRPAQGARRNDKIAEPDHHCLGRSRGGLTTKIHALIDATIRPDTVLLSPGQAADNPHLNPAARHPDPHWPPTSAPARR